MGSVRTEVEPEDEDDDADDEEEGEEKGADALGEPGRQAFSNPAGGEPGSVVGIGPALGGEAGRVKHGHGRRKAVGC